MQGKVSENASAKGLASIAKGKNFLAQVFSSDPESRTLLRSTWAIAWPVVVEQALSMLSQVVDMAMVGRLGPDAIAAIGLSMQPFLLVNALFMGLSVGTTALAARAVGAGKKDEAGLVTGESCIAALILGVIISYLGAVKADWVTAFMKAEPPVRVLGAQYVRAMMPGMLLFFVFTVAGGALRGAGDTRTPMIINLALNVVHVFTNYLFIFGNLGFPRMEVAGAGLSTSVSRILGGIAILLVVSSPNSQITVDWRKTFSQFDWGLFRKILNIGVPAMAERVLTSSGQIAYARQVAGLGTISYAAHSLSLNVESFSYMPGMGFATAATSLVGTKLGARDPEGAEKSALIAMVMALLTMGGFGTLFFLFPRYFLLVFTSDPEIISRAIPLLRIVAFTQIPESLGFSIPGALRGAGDTKIAMYVTIVGVWIVRLGLTYLLMQVFHMGLSAAWIAMFMDWVVRASLYWIRLKSGKWKTLEF